MEKEFYPLEFQPLPFRKPWGGTALMKNFGKKFLEAGEDGGMHPVCEEELIGESWELTDIGGNDSVVSTGWLAGKKLSGILKEYGDRVLGKGVWEKYGPGFPLLIKILDIEGKLSVQVHPDDSTAAARYNSKGKAEMWYVLDAKPEARVYMGFNRDVPPEEFYNACKTGTADRLLNVILPKKGDTIFIEPGTVHAAEGGIVVLEIQESSEAVLRLYDWGRELNPATARPMHLDEAMDVINFKKYNGSGFMPDASATATERVCIVDCPQFTVDRITLFDKVEATPPDKKRFVVYNCIKGEVSLVKAAADGQSQSFRLSPGDTILLPAECTGYFLEPAVPGSELLQSTVI